MGLGYQELLSLTWREWDYYSRGYERRIERDWDRTRHMISSMFNSSGFSKRKMRPQEVRKLRHLDRPQPFKKVKQDTIDKYLKFLDNADNKQT